MRFSLTRLFVVVALGLLASACSNFYSLAPRSAIKAVGNLAIVDVGVIMATGKTLGDQFVSYRTGKDCSTVRLEQGRTYCREDEPNPVMSTKNCEHTLGDVTCYVASAPSSQVAKNQKKSSIPSLNSGR